MAPRSYDALPDSPQWRPGFLKRIPAPCLLAIFLSICCAAGALATLVSSDDADIDRWPSKQHTVKLSVILAIFSALANTALRFALSEGITLAWWIKALQGETINGLHRRWAYGTSFKETVLSGKRFNKVALACLITSMVVIDGPLLQQASSVETKPAFRNTTVVASLSTNPLPWGFSGLYLSRAKTVDMFKPSFAQVVQDYQARRNINSNHTGCQGSCDVVLVAAGFDVNCSYGTKQFDIVSNTRGESFDVGSLATGWSSVENAGQLTTNVTYKGDTACVGELKTVQCVSSAAVVEYPIRISNGSVLLLPSNNKTIKIQDPNTLIESSSPGLSSTYGGLALAISQQFPASDISLYFTAQWAIQGNGNMATTYLASQSSVGSCNVSWSDPTSDILSFTRELMFRSAIAASNESNTQAVHALDSYSRTVYVSHYGFLAAALAIMVLEIFVLFPLLWGWWKLDRNVTFSPVEIAKAFRAPLLTEVGKKDDINALLAEVGEKTIRYGFVTVPVGKEEGAQAFGGTGREIERADEDEAVELVDRSIPTVDVLGFEEFSKFQRQ